MTAYTEQFNDYLAKEKEVSSNTLESYMRDVNRFITYLEQRGIDSPAQADKEVVEGFLQNLRDKNKSNATITRMLASVRAYYQFLMKSGLASGNPAKQIKLEKVTKKNPEVLTDKEIRQLLATPNVGEIKGARDKAMLEMLYATGIRVSELINLNIEDVRCEKGERGEVTCRSPRGARTVPMYRDATESLYYYINSVRPLLVSEDSGNALFINLNGNRLSRQELCRSRQHRQGDHPPHPSPLLCIAPLPERRLAARAPDNARPRRHQLHTALRDAQPEGGVQRCLRSLPPDVLFQAQTGGRRARAGRLRLGQRLGQLIRQLKKAAGKPVMPI